jgi:hypothetical protein
MRLWTFHPKYLDSRGLVALWREGLLAQAVLRGETQGYVNHPQLTRFRNTASPVQSIAAYLGEIRAEAKRRDYRFDKEKIIGPGSKHTINTTQGQILKTLESIPHPAPHPLFHIIPGPVEEWEVV